MTSDSTSLIPVNVIPHHNILTIILVIRKPSDQFYNSAANFHNGVTSLTIRVYKIISHPCSNYNIITTSQTIGHSNTIFHIPHRCSIPFMSIISQRSCHFRHAKGLQVVDDLATIDAWPTCYLSPVSRHRSCAAAVSPVTPGMCMCHPHKAPKLPVTHSPLNISMTSITGG